MTQFIPSAQQPGQAVVNNNAEPRIWHGCCQVSCTRLQQRFIGVN
jgi:hypothetical protein